MNRLILLLGVTLPLAPPAAGREGRWAARFDYRTPAGVAYVVNADRLAEVRLGRTPGSPWGRRSSSGWPEKPTGA